MSQDKLYCTWCTSASSARPVDGWDCNHADDDLKAYCTAHVIHSQAWGHQLEILTGILPPTASFKTEVQTALTQWLNSAPDGASRIAMPDSLKKALDSKRKYNSDEKEDMSEGWETFVGAEPPEKLVNGVLCNPS